MNKGSLKLLRILAHFKCYKTRCDDCALYFGDSVPYAVVSPLCICTVAQSLLTRANEKLAIDMTKTIANVDLHVLNSAERQEFINMFIDNEYKEDVYPND